MRPPATTSAADLLQRRHAQGTAGQNYVRRERHQFRRVFAFAVGIILAPASIDPNILVNSPAQFLEALVERRNSVLTFRIVRSPVHEQADAPHAIGLLRARCKRPRCCGTAD
jgi:hypothetical protein